MATRSILLINGPNLNMLGTRKPEIYGNTTLADIERDLIALGAAGSPSLTITAMQSNHEGEIIDAIHTAGKDADGIIINAGAFTHYSIAIRDALDSIATPFVEVHISNVYKREEFRHHSVLSAIADGVIVGFGVDGYRLALEWFRGELSNQP